MRKGTPNGVVEKGCTHAKTSKGEMGVPLEARPSSGLSSLRSLETKDGLRGARSIG